jgi:hypothetical protein
MQAMIYLDQVFYPRIRQLTVDDGYKLPIANSFDYAQVLFIENSAGPVNKFLLINNYLIA